MAKMTLDDIVAQLRAAYGDSLRTVLLYGSAAGPEPYAKDSDYNVLVIVSALSLEPMRAAGAVARSWGEAGNPPPLTLTDAEWRSSVDVFAMEHADIRDRHRVLFAAPGYDALDGVTVSHRDIRHQLEYEALATLLGLRARILATDATDKAQLEILTSSSSRVLALFRALLRLAGEVPAAKGDAVCRAAAARAGFDAAPFSAVLAHRHGTSPLTGDRVGQTLAAYHAALGRFVAYLDALPTVD